MIGQKGCVLEVGLEYPKELRELYNLYNTHIGNVKILFPNFFDKKNMCVILKTCNFTYDQD